MKFIHYYLSLLLCAVAVCFSSCEQEENIGSSITKGEVAIEIDSLFSVSGHSVRVSEFDSRSSSLMLGRLAAEEYGTLDCSFAAQLMPASTLTISDTIPLEDICGMKLKFAYQKSGITGDSLAPHQLSVFRLIRALPADINNLTDLDGYYSASSLLGTKNYNASALGTSLKASKSGVISIDIDPQFARDVVKEYRTNPSIFSTPQNFAEKFAGIYVKPTFGRGLVMNMSTTEFTTYYNYRRKVTVVRDGVSVTIDSLLTDSTTLFSVSPEVLSANLMKLTPAQSLLSYIQKGDCILQGPGGYNVEVTFPARQIIERYYKEDFNLSVVNTLSFEIPVRDIPNNFGITRPPYLLMIKTSKLADFFLQNKLPQENDTDCFYAEYNELTDSYTFSAMRPYIVELMNRGGKVEESDEQFTILPVSITTEKVQVSYDTYKTLVTACNLYIEKPVLCRLDIDAAKVRFTYSRQIMK